MGLVTEVIEDESSLLEVSVEWDRLAVESERPFCAPAWMLAWWRNVRPDAAELRVVVITDGDQLVGIAPFWTLDGSSRRANYEILAARLSAPTGPLAAPGREAGAAEEFGRALAGARPRPSLLLLEDLAGAEGWDRRLDGAWPRPGPWVLRSAARPLPIVTLDGLDFDAWIAGRSSKFRQESSRLRRRLDDAGARFLLAGPGEVDRALDAFENLHGARWSDRGGSNALVPGLRGMLIDVARELLPGGRFRIFMIEAEGSVVAVNILLAAGPEVSGWNSGFDQSWGRLSPSLQLTLHAVADAAERGEARMSLGPGGKDYKLRLADSQREVAVSRLLPRGLLYPFARLRLAPQQTRIGISNRLSTGTKQRIRSLVRR
jgi:CelD/BcsL family acetyltransferase involved in cellulose biosynthesis